MKKITLLSLLVVIGTISFAQCTNTTITKNGLFHAAAPGNERVQYNIPMPAGEDFDKITVDVDVKQGPWNNGATNFEENHNIFRLQRGQIWSKNLYGYVNVFGPTQDIAKMANNITQPAGGMAAKTKPFSPVQGTTYHYKYVYDASGGQIKLTVSLSANQLVQMTDIPAQNFISSDPDGNTSAPGFFISFGHGPPFSPTIGPEVPTYGWEYSNLVLSFTCSATGIIPVEMNSITVFPNPSTDQVNIQWALDFNPKNIRIYNVFGQIMYDHLISNQGTSEFSLDVSEFSNGLYLVEVDDNQNNKQIHRIMVMH